MLGLEPHGQLAAASQPPAELGRRLALYETTRPRGEEALTTELIELGQHRHRVIGGLDSEIVEITTRWVGQRRGSAPHLEPRLPVQQRMQAAEACSRRGPIESSASIQAADSRSETAGRRASTAGADIARTP
jgi:hypothetical protein